MDYDGEMISSMKSPQQVHAFWFGDLGDGTCLPSHSAMWFRKSDEADAKIREAFSSTLLSVETTPSQEWTHDARSQAALIVLLDQFPRNIFRNQERAFAFDRSALRTATALVDSGQDRSLFAVERCFVCLPFQHAEDLGVQEHSVHLYQRLLSEGPESLQNYLSQNLRFAKRHHEIIARFGRFPHRNAILKRTSTPEELAFLAEPNSSF